MTKFDGCARVRVLNTSPLLLENCDSPNLIGTEIHKKVNMLIFVLFVPFSNVVFQDTNNKVLLLTQMSFVWILQIWFRNQLFALYVIVYCFNARRQ